MKKSEIKVGGLYLARVATGSVTKVRVEAIREIKTSNGFRYQNFVKLIYDVTVLATGRRLTLSSAARFQSPVPLDIEYVPLTVND